MLLPASELARWARARSSLADRDQLVAEIEELAF
jgi:hypothetical protein